MYMFFFSIHLPFATPTAQLFIVTPPITPTSFNSLRFPSLLTPLHTFCPEDSFRKEE